MTDSLRESINAGAGPRHQLSKQILGLDWYDTEPQARRVIEHLFAQEPYPHDHPLHKAVFLARESYSGGETFEDGVRGLIAELSEARHGGPRRVLLLCSYCGEDAQGCTDETPCLDCLQMCNVAVASGPLDVLGGIGYLRQTGTTPQPKQEPTAFMKDNSPMAGHTDFMRYEAWMADGISAGWEALYAVPPAQDVVRGVTFPTPAVLVRWLDGVEAGLVLVEESTVQDEYAGDEGWRGYYKEEDLQALHRMAREWLTEKASLERTNARLQALLELRTGQLQAAAGRGEDTTSDLYRFLNAAAGDDVACDGVEAAQLYIALYPETYAHTVASITGRPPKEHPDDAAVDAFAASMKNKLAASREKGRHGWQAATQAHLSALLYRHVFKGDPLDVGNLAMMLHQNGQAIELPQEARGTHPAPAQIVMPDIEPYPCPGSEYFHGFNAGCAYTAREVVRLNASAKPTPAQSSAVLLSMLEHVVHDERVPNEVSQELAAELIVARSMVDDALQPQQPDVAGLPGAARDVLAERSRQVEAEGWTPEHDDGHEDGQMAEAAACYALFAAEMPKSLWLKFWPWEGQWLKRSDPRRMLVKAGALLLAEIERMDRASADKGE